MKKYVNPQKKKAQCNRLKKDNFSKLKKRSSKKKDMDMWTSE